VGITLTESAARHVQACLDGRGKGEGIRVGIKTSGCSGLAYLDGTEMDFVKEGLNEGFKFSNPNQKGECGCGESFTV